MSRPTAGWCSPSGSCTWASPEPVPITTLDTWLGAFNTFADARKNAGVRAQRVHQPVDDPRCIVVDLEFNDPDAAHGFKDFLEGVVWQSQDLSPGLDGAPTARVLEDVDPGRLQ